jgi:hypothetical protein
MPTTTLVATATTDIHDPAAWCPLRKLHQRHPDIGGPTDSRARWWVRHADTNGLAEAGAIARAGREIIIHVPRLVGWLASRGLTSDPRTEHPSIDSNTLNRKTKNERCARRVHHRGTRGTSSEAAEPSPPLAAREHKTP